jgi:hypothetical protein
MYTPSDETPRGGWRWIGAALVALAVPAALAGIAASAAPGTIADADADAAAAAAAPRPAPAGGGYQIRCWQYGRLLFEENRVTLPADAARYGIKMAGTDRRNKPIYVADTRNATCLIRSAVESPPWPMERPGPKTID